MTMCIARRRWSPARRRPFAAAALLLAAGALACPAAPAPAEVPANLRRENLVAWCIVPFDSRQRTPAQRAEMLARLGLKRVAYDWRENHVPTFEEEIRQYQAHGIEYFAFWGAHEQAFALFEKYGLHPQIWQTAPSPAGESDVARVQAAAKQLLPLVERTRQLGCRLGLYNHGGWGGEPANLVAVCRYLREQQAAEHVGIVYNLHHAHDHLDDLAASLTMMQPYLLCLNLNGMTHDGERRGLKILPLGEGELDLRCLRTIRESGYDGPIGIIGHTQDDVAERLQDNLDGLEWLLPQLEGRPAGPKPQPRTWSPEQAARFHSTATDTSAAGFPGVLLEGRAEYRQPPLSIECRAALTQRAGYNILVASDSKQSGSHWELFSMAGSGTLTAYLPGCQPDHVRSEAMICDGAPHTLAMLYEPSRVQLFVDGRQVADQAISRSGAPSLPGGLGIGRLVEGGLGCTGTVAWVRLSRGVREVGDASTDVAEDDATLLLWRPVAATAARRASHAHRPEANTLAHPESTPAGGGVQLPEFTPQIVAEWMQRARTEGDPHRGLAVFAAAKSSCLACHKLGQYGGTVGPDLLAVARQRRPEELVESVLWPKRTVRPEFVARLVIDSHGQSHTGYVVRQDDRSIVLRDPTRPQAGEITLTRDEIEVEREVGTLMPDNLTASMTPAQLADLLQFVMTMGTDAGVPAAETEAFLDHALAHLRGGVSFPYDRKPLHPDDWPLWEHPVNRDRLYDFYSKQADYFRVQPSLPPLLTEYPGLDGGTLGHWGNQNEEVWKDARWNDVRLGSVQGGIFRGGGGTVPRGVCIRLGEHGEVAACFDPETRAYRVLWTGGFVSFSDVRHGFMHGLQMSGRQIGGDDPVQFTGPAANRATDVRYRGYYRHGDRVLFAFRAGETEWLDAPRLRDGQFEHVTAPAAEHPERRLIEDFPAQWPEVLETAIEHGTGRPYAVDTIGLPFENPWKALLFCGGHAFLPDGSALVATMHGDVWRVTEFAYPSRRAKWRRFASGLHHPQGLWCDEEGIFVLGRDQITRLHDLNGDGEADFYEAFSRAYETSPAGHDFICGLERDAAGRFYTASGNQGLVRISADGERAEVLATGFRNPDGLGLLPDGTVTVPCSEGDWTPASMICAVRPAAEPLTGPPPHCGYRGPQNGQPPVLPLAYLPRGLDNSSGGQTTVASDRWGPLAGQLLHFSFGTGTHFLVLRDEVEGQLQGTVVPLRGEFRSGVHRGRFRPQDGQLYVSGMQGWGSYTPDDGCFQRVRYTGGRVQLPVACRMHENGVAITFAEPLAAAVASDPRSHFAQCWNYRYGPQYGSPEFSSRHPGLRGHDTLPIAAAHLLDDGRTLFLELPDLQPVNQLHLRVQSAAGEFHDLFATVHKLAPPCTQIPGYVAVHKVLRPHPILADLALATRSIPNPLKRRLPGAREVTIETGSNLTYATRSFTARPNEVLALTLRNPDVVPHNWALVRPGTLERVGELSNRLIADPEAALRQYIPETTDILGYCDVVDPGEETTIYFKAPSEPGRYPYLCTFPGHWRVMNGELLVESPAETSAK